MLHSNLEHIEVEQKIIHLMLKYPESINEMLESGDVLECFSPEHSNIVSAIFSEFVSSKKTRKLTRDSYAHFLQARKKTDDLLADLHTFDNCLLSAWAKPDEIGVLKKLMFENYVTRQSNILFTQYKDQIKTSGTVAATTVLVDKLQNSLKLTRARKTINIRTISDMKEVYLSELESRRNNPDHKITCGYPEIDESMRKGFKAMHLTLIVADVGSHKTNLMMNIGLNIADAGHNVMFIALEMPAEDLVTRIIANRMNLNSDWLDNPQMAPDEYFDKLKTNKVFDNNRFAILDGNRFSVSEIEGVIEKWAPVFKPKVVIIDYVSILKSENNFHGRNDLEIGEILKSLRFLGLKYDFHILTAAQMGRATIKALKENKDNAVDSTSISGSHQYSADSDTIFALIKIPNETDRIKINVIKARHGPSGVTKELRVDPAHYRISSTQMSQTLIDGMNSNLEDELNIPMHEIEKSVKKATTIDFAGMNFDDDPPKAVNDGDDIASMGL